MPPEDPGWGKFPQLMANKVFRNVYRNPGFAVVYGDRTPYHFGDDRRTAGIGFYHSPVPGLAHLKYLFVKALFDKGPLLNRSRHSNSF